MLAPWSLTLLTTRSRFLHGGRPGRSATGAASALDLLGISPGGPGTVGGLLLIGIVLAALAALLRGERQFGDPHRLGRRPGRPALRGRSSNGSAWAGPATLVYGLALLAAAALGADGATRRASPSRASAGASRSPR